MAESPVSASAGTMTSVVGSEATMYSSTASGLFSFVVDLNNMASGDIVELREYQIVLTGGTSRVISKMIFTDAQPTDSMIAVFDPLGTDLTDTGAVKYTLKQTQGTARQFAFKIVQY